MNLYRIEYRRVDLSGKCESYVEAPGAVRAIERVTEEHEIDRILAASLVSRDSVLRTDGDRKG